MRDIVLTLIVIGVIPYIFTKPVLGIYVWNWFAFMNPHRLTFGFAYNFPFSMIIAILTILSLVFSKDKKLIPWYPITFVLLFFIAWMCITTVFSLDPELAFSEWKRTIKIQIMVFVAIIVLNERQDLQRLIWIIVASLGFFGVKGGLFVIATAGQYLVWGPPGSFIEDNNAMALALVITIPLMRYLQITETNIWVKRGLFLAIVLTTFSIVSSYSRGAFLAALAMMLFIWLKGRKKTLIAGVLVSLTVILLTFMPQEWSDRMQTIDNYAEDGSAMGRINAWMFAYNLASDRPIVGGGFRTFTDELFYVYAPDPLDSHDAHSIYFEVLGEHGFVGLFLFLILGILALRTGSKIIKYTRKREDLLWARDLASMIQVSLIGYAVGGAFLGLAYFDLPYTLIAILIVARSIVEKEVYLKSEYREVTHKEPADSSAVG